ncbi:MAG: efflux RND transporter periplasmic adaptor subunit [Prolixibacteraceae bacterium]|nr:efflux RND transporter periplasmic adaptor subunit [Prolixibacteraceae bacterium]
MKISYLSTIILLVSISFASCDQTTNNDEATKTDDTTIQFTRQQFEATDMKIDNPKVRTINNTIRTNGYIKPSPDGVAKINAVIPGIINGLKHSEGTYIKQGEILFRVSGREVVNVQNNYVKACSDFDYAQTELDRISKLVDDQITAQKELTNAKNIFKIAKAEKKSLEAILNLMHLDPTRVEQGNISAQYKVPAPIGGYLSKLNIDNGQYIEPQNNAAIIVDNKKLQLVLNVFEKDIRNLSPGQTVLFYDPDRKSDKQKATITSIGRSINQDTKTIPCVSKIENIEEKMLMNGMYAECEVIIDSRKVNTLPQEAIITENTDTFVLVKANEEDNKITFNKVKVDIGSTSAGYTEVKTKELENVLIRGSYYY